MCYLISMFRKYNRIIGIKADSLMVCSSLKEKKIVILAIFYCSKYIITLAIFYSFSNIIRLGCSSITVCLSWIFICVLYITQSNVLLRMEKVALKSRSSQAKILGTIVSISGAFIVTLYKGPPLLGFSSPSDSYLHLPVSQYSNWALGGLLLTVTCLSSATWKIFQVISCSFERLYIMQIIKQCTLQKWQL